MKPLRIEGMQVLAGEEPIRLRGVNVGNMLLVEHFMIGLPWTEFKLREKMLGALGPQRYRAFWQTYLDGYFTDKDAQYLAEAGVNIVRLPLNYRYFHADGQGTFSIHDVWAYIDKVVSLCKARGIYVMLDLHAVPGMQARDWNAESSFGDSLFWRYRQFHEETAEILVQLARRYKNEPAVMGYDLMNEPVAPDVSTYRFVMGGLIAAVRAEDAHKIIVVEPNPWGKEIATFDPAWLADTQLIVSPHHYFLQYEPFATATTYPVVDKAGREQSREDFEAIYKGYWDAQAVPRPFLMGEFGVHASYGEAGAQNCILRDALDFFERSGLHWTIWNYKDVGKMGMVAPRDDSAWKKFLARPLLDGVRSRVEGALERFSNELTQLVPEYDASSFVHMRREMLRDWQEIACDYVAAEFAKLSEPELVALAQSWSFDHCQEVAGRMDVLREFLK